MSPPTSPLRVAFAPRFRAFFAAAFLSAFNDNVFKNGVALLVMSAGLTAAGMPAETVVLVSPAVFIVPFFLLSATAGQLADRYEGTRMIRAVKLAEIPIMGVAALGFWTLSAPTLLAALFCMGAQSAFMGPIKYGILPDLLAPDELVAGNAVVEMGTFIAILIGTVLGGALATAGGNATHYLAAAVVFLALLGYLAARAMPSASPARPEVQVQWDLVRPTIEVLRLTAKKPAVFRSVLAISWFWLVGAVVLSVFPVYVEHALGAEARAAVLLQAIFCVGIAVGSLLTERISGKYLELGLVPLGSFGLSLFLLDLYFVGVHPAPADGLRTLEVLAREPFAQRVMGDLLGLSLFGGIFSVPLYTLLQERAEEGERSRIIAGNNVLNAIFMAVGTALFAWLQGRDWSIPECFGLLSLMNFLVALYIYSVVPEFLLRFYAWLLGRLMYRLDVTGMQHCPEHGPAVYVCNHVSFVDWLIIGGTIRRPLRFVMDHRIFRTPVVGTLFRHAKTIPIAPAKEDEALMNAAFDRIAAELDAGEVVCIFPEGMLTPDGTMQQFRRGIERILERNPVPVVPMGLDGLWGSMFSRRDGPAMSRPPRGFRSPIRLTIGPPIAAKDATSETLTVAVSALLGEERMDTLPPPEPDDSGAS